MILKFYLPIYHWFMISANYLKYLIITQLDVLEVIFLEWLDTENNSRGALKMTGNNDSTEKSPQYQLLLYSNTKAVRVLSFVSWNIYSKKPTT